MRNLSINIIGSKDKYRKESLTCMNHDGSFSWIIDEAVIASDANRAGPGSRCHGDDQINKTRTRAEKDVEG